MSFHLNSCVLKVSQVKRSSVYDQPFGNVFLSAIEEPISGQIVAYLLIHQSWPLQPELSFLFAVTSFLPCCHPICLDQWKSHSMVDMLYNWMVH